MNTKSPHFGGDFSFEEKGGTLDQRSVRTLNVCILMGSPRKQGNTAALLDPFCEELERGGAEVEIHWLYDMEIRPCLACRACQRDWSVFGCSQKDDAQLLFDHLLAADLTHMHVMDFFLNVQWTIAWLAVVVLLFAHYFT